MDEAARLCAARRERVHGRGLVGTSQYGCTFGGMRVGIDFDLRVAVWVLYGF